MGSCFVAMLGLASALVVVRSAAISQVSTGTWVSAGNGDNMSSPRAGAATVLLQDGRLLLTGGDSGGGALASADIFDASGNFSSAAPP